MSDNPLPLFICVALLSLYYNNVYSHQVVCEEIRRLAPKAGLHHDGVVFGSDDFCASIGTVAITTLFIFLTLFYVIVAFSRFWSFSTKKTRQVNCSLLIKVSQVILLFPKGIIGRLGTKYIIAFIRMRDDLW